MPRITFHRIWSSTEPEWDRAEVPWLVRMAVRWGITILAFVLAEVVLGWIYTEDRFLLDGWEAVLAAPAIFVAVRALLRPVLLFLTCPLQIITLGLFIFVINALIVLFTDMVCGWLGVRFEVDGFFPAFLGALVISAVSFAISRFLRFNPLSGYRLT